MGVTDMACNAVNIRIARNECLKDFILLLITRLQRNAVLQITLGRIIFIAQEMLRLNAKENIDVGKTLGAEIPCLFPCPQ